jgi:hypothetical protein
MRKIYRFLKSPRLILSVATLFTAQVKAQVSAYTFTQTTGTYAPVIGTDLFGTTWNDNVSPTVPLGFTFQFNAVSYSSVAVSSNGFLTFGTTAPGVGNYLPVSNGAAYAGAISAFGKDLSANTGATGVSYTVTGVAPNRKFVAQWENAKRIGGDVINFQIILNETSNKIDLMYGASTATNTANSNKVQVGLRGASNGDFNNRSGGNGTAWNALSAGTANTDNVNYKSSVVPASGLTFSWIAPACFPTSTPIMTGLGITAATFSWTSPGSVFDVYYGPTPITAPTATTVPTATISVNTYTMGGLISGTTYAFYVRNNCGAGNTSSWSQVTTFIAPCTTTNVPYVQNFESTIDPALPTCTSAQNVGNGNTWITSSPSANGFLSHTLTYEYNTNFAANTWFYTRGLNLTAGVSYRLTYRYGSSDATYTERLRVNYGMSPLSGAMTTTLAIHPNIINDVTSITSTVDFTPATTGIYYIGFQAYSIANQFNLYVDDISVSLTPSCLEPTASAISAVTATTAVGTWTTAGSATTWDVFYGPSPLPIPTTTTVPTSTVSVNTYSLSGLTPSTQYSFYVRSHCSVSDKSTWTGPNTFVTPCLPPSIASTTPSVRCGIGTATLGATSAGNLSWFTAASGGTAVATGSVYTTPVINTTTTFYVSASSAPYMSTGGILTPIPTGTTSTSPFYEGIMFDATQTFTLNSVDVYPNGPSDDIYLSLYDVNYNLIGFYNGTMPAGNGATAFTLPLNFIVPPGTDYHFEASTANGTALIANTGVSYPYGIGSVVSITSGFDGSGPTSSDYYYIYNLNATSICEGPRTMITASVTPPPALTVTSGTTVCANVISTINVTSTVSNFNNYVWAPNTNLYTNTGGTTAYSGTSANTVYYKSSTNGPTIYTLTATNSSNCVNITTLTMVADVPVIQASATPSAACQNATVALLANNLVNGGVTVGSGTGSTGTQGITPYGSNYEGSREQYLFRASELQALNLRAGSITALSFNVTLQGIGTYAQSNFNIKMAHTTNTVLTSAYGTPSGPITTVYGPTTQGLPTLGINTYNFSSSFNWDGVSNILVDICHDNDVNANCASCYSSNSEVAFTNPGFDCVWGSYADNAQSCGTQASNTTFDVVSRPNIIFAGQVVNTGSNITWLMNPGSINTNTATITASTLGTQVYTVAATNNITGCSNNTTTSFTVNPTPSVTVAATSSTLCSGTSVSLTATGATTYSWMPAGGSASVAVVSPAATTMYTVTGTNPGCSTTQTISLNVTPTPTVTASASPNAICSGTTLTLTASGANTYSWMPNSSASGTTTATPIVSTTYTISGTNAGCTNTKTLSVTVNDVPTLTVTTNPVSGALCTTGATATLTATGTSTAYVWSNTANTASTSVAPTTTTVYSVTGTNSCGVKTVTVSIAVATTPTISAATSSSLSCANSLVMLTTSATPGVSYSWNTGATTTSISVSPSVTTTYTVTGTNACGTATATIVQNVSTCIGVEEILTGNAISIYPNPANNYVNIAIPASLTSGNTSIEVTDALGKLVMTEALNKDATTLNTTLLVDGIYFFKVITNNQTIKVGKVVKH